MIIFLGFNGSFIDIFFLRKKIFKKVFRVL